MLSFVGNKKNKQWIWLAMDAKTRQVIALYVGDRSKRSARILWKSIRDCYKQKAIFHTDKYDAYQGVIPVAQHRAVYKLARKADYT